MPSSPVRVAIEIDLLERIVQPLLDNALRYGEAQVSVTLRVNGTTAVVDVEDDGTGLRETEVDIIFEPGVRGAAAATDVRGAGLGLALARRLARTAGGEIVAQSNAAGGRFTVRLPLA
jgi:signal transduction histidine kinase